jgi:hypothetical protein
MSADLQAAHGQPISDEQVARNQLALIEVRAKAHREEAGRYGGDNAETDAQLAIINALLAVEERLDKIAWHLARLEP